MTRELFLWLRLKFLSLKFLQPAKTAECEVAESYT